MKRFPRRHVTVATVALVGLGIALPGASANAPPGRYMIPGDGTVYDTKTKLTWQRAVPDPVAKTYTEAEAATYCTNPGLPGAGWRLPTMNELLTIVDFTAMNPAIDSTAFPNTPFNGNPSDKFDTGSYWALPAGNGSAYIVDFAYGGNNVVSAAWHSSARCVR